MHCALIRYLSVVNAAAIVTIKPTMVFDSVLGGVGGWVVCGVGCGGREGREKGQVGVNKPKTFLCGRLGAETLAPGPPNWSSKFLEC